MLELRRNMTEVGIMVDDETMGTIMPWMWYWHDPSRNLNFSLKTVKAWKDQASLKSLSTNISDSKEYDALIRSQASEKRSLLKEVKDEYIETLYVQE